MKILIVSFFNRWVTHLGAELELAEKHLQQGDSVTFLACDGSVGACMTNPNGDIAECRECILRRADGIMQLSGDVEVYSLGAPPAERDVMIAKGKSKSLTLEDYKAVRYKGHDLGWAALSSAMSLHCDPFCSSKEAMQSVDTFFTAACRSYEGTRRFLRTHPDFDRAYVFNGRFAVTRGSLRALQDAKIPFFTHERGCSIKHYDLFRNTLPHNRTLRQARAEEVWNSVSDQIEREKIAHEFYQEKKNGQSVAWNSWTESQTPNALPDCWNRADCNIVIFNTSQDELAAISDEFASPVYQSQAEAVMRITKDTLDTGKAVHYYLRVHPRLAQVKNASVEDLLAVRSPNLTIIGAEDKISSYALLEACDRVLTFASTMGVEATYWGKPSILAGKSFYDELDVAYLPASHEEVMDLLLDDNLAPKDRLGALKYGYYNRTRGIPFEHWKPQDFVSGYFGGMFMGNLHKHGGDRLPLHITIFLWLMNFCKSKRALKVADRLAKYISLSCYQIKKRLRPRRRLHDLAVRLRLR